MRGLHDTISRLGALRQRPFGLTELIDSRLAPFQGFGSNPGRLAAWAHDRQGLPKGAPLVVVLHGCTQNARGYDHGSGWSAAADEHGFAVLFPEQQRPTTRTSASTGTGRGRAKGRLAKRCRSARW